jgi:transposase
MKATLTRLGIRNFNPKVQFALLRLQRVRTPEGAEVPARTFTELRHDMERLDLVKRQIKDVEEVRLAQLSRASGDGRHAMVRVLSRVVGVGVETADILVQEAFVRDLRDRRAVARYAGLTGAPDESGKKRRERGLAKAGNARVRRVMIQLAWRFLLHQKNSPLAEWYRARTAELTRGKRKTMIVALARKLLIVLWRLTITGEVPEGLLLHSPA